MNNNEVKIVGVVGEAFFLTHSGVFHADEVMATAILSAVGPVALARVNKVPEGTAAFVYDVGGGKYDHHQKGGGGSRENGVPFSSAGMIWRDFGKALVSCDQAWAFVDQELIQGIDSIDNGVYPVVDYAAKAATISSLISGFNPEWDSEEASDEAFLKAVAFAQGVLARAIASAEAKARAKALVDEAIRASENRVVILPRFAPWQEYILSSASKKAEEALFVVFPSNRGGYNVQSIPDRLGSFGNRKALPEAWRGLPPEGLRKVCGVADATFVHAAGFIGGAETLEGALEMAKKAIANEI